MQTIHTPTNAPCTVMRVQDGRAFCNFGERANPFTWVKLEELSPRPLAGSKLVLALVARVA